MPYRPLHVIHMTKESTTAATSLVVELSSQSTFWGRHPGIHALEPMARPTLHHKSEGLD
jgi:hypothetical protein